MILKALGILDLLCTLVLVLIGFSLNISWIIVFITGVYLLFKVLIFIFSFNLASAFDLFAALCLLFSLMFVVPNVLFFIAAVLIGQKGIFSLLA